VSRSHDRHGQHVYGSAHKALRKRFAARMKRGEVFYCWRPSCLTPGVPIDPRSWDLGHIDPELRNRFGTRHPEHPACNRATMTHLKERLAAGNGVPRERRAGATDRFGGLPDPTPGNTVERWSRHWSGGGFNPRCPDCLREGGACGLARRFAAAEGAA
jgi:hypothetical protein